MCSVKYLNKQACGHHMHKFPQTLDTSNQFLPLFPSEPDAFLALEYYNFGSLKNNFWFETFVISWPTCVVYISHLTWRKPTSNTHVEIVLFSAMDSSRAA